MPDLVRLPLPPIAVLDVWVILPADATPSELKPEMFPSVSVPLVWVKESAPVEVMVPAVWLKLFVVVKLPAPPMLPPVIVSPLKFRLVATFNVPAESARVTLGLVPLIEIVSTNTGPASAVPPSVLLKLTVVPEGITTVATLDLSGTAPPSHLVESSQLPVAPPVHVTEFKRVISPVSPVG